MLNTSHMSPILLDRLTPRAYPRTRLLTAAIVWSTVGVFLSVKGIYLSKEESLAIIAPVMLTGLMLGMLKGRFILDRVAAKIILHIGAKPTRACLGGLFSVRNWLLIAVMIIFGRTLSVLPIEAGIKTGLYVMVGSGLAYSSRLLWRAWKKSTAETP